MKKLITGIALFVYSFCIAGTALAQIKGVNEGDQIRITAPSISEDKITGIVIDTSLISIIRISKENYHYPNPKWIDIPLVTIEQLEVWKEARRTGRGALVGAGLGGFTMGIIVMASNEPCETDEWCFIEFSNGEAFLMGTIVGILPGAFIGAIVGSTIKTEKWKRIRFEITSEPITKSYLKLGPTPGFTLKWSF